MLIIENGIIVVALLAPKVEIWVLFELYYKYYCVNTSLERNFITSEKPKVESVH
jgi:hypothetical protein